MKTINIIIILFLTHICFGQQVFVHSKESSKIDFQKNLKEMSAQSLTQFFNETRSIQDLNSLQISDQIDELRLQIIKIQSLPLRFSEVEFLIAIYEKIGLQNLTGQEKSYLYSLFLNYEGLQKSNPTIFNSILHSKFEKNNFYSKEDLLALQDEENKGQFEFFVDGINLKRMTNPIFKTDHQWLAVSDSYYPIIIFGSLENFKNMLSAKKSFDNQCKANIYPWKDIPSLVAINLDAQLNCESLNSSRNLNNSHGQSPFESFDLSHVENYYKNNSSGESYVWAIPIIAVGAIVTVNYFKNKQVVWHLPSLKF